LSRVTLRENGGGPGRTSLSAHESYLQVEPGGVIEHAFAVMPSRGVEDASAAYLGTVLPSAAAARQLAELEKGPFKPVQAADVVATGAVDGRFGVQVEKDRSLILLSTCGTTYRVEPQRSTLIKVSDSNVRIFLNCRRVREEMLYPGTMKEARVEVNEPRRKRVTTVYALENRDKTEQGGCELEMSFEISDASKTLLMDARFKNLSKKEWPVSTLMLHFVSEGKRYYTPGPRVWFYEGEWRKVEGNLGWLYLPNAKGGLGVLPGVGIGEGSHMKKSFQLLGMDGYRVTPPGGMIRDRYAIFPASGVEDCMLGCLRTVVCMKLDRRAYLRGEAVRVVRLRVAKETAERAESARGRLVDSDGRVMSRWESPLDRIGEQQFKTDELRDGVYSVVVELLNGKGECVAGAVERLRMATEEDKKLVGEIAALEKRLTAATEAGAAGADALERAAGILEKVRLCREGRDYALAWRHARRLRVRLGDIESGRSGYFTDVAMRARQMKAGDGALVTVSWRAGSGAVKEAIEWAKNLGATELCFMGQPTQAELKQVRDAGLRTAALFGALAGDAEWAKEHPEQRQMAFYVSDDVKAELNEVTISVPGKRVGWSAMVDFEHAKQLWRVQDGTTGALIPAERWDATQEKGKGLVRITGTVPGHVYRVYYILTVRDFCDPVHEEFREHAIGKLEEYLKTLGGQLQTFFTDDTAYAWPGTVSKAYEWDSYHFGSSPKMQQEFEKATGIKFDPAMLVGKDIEQAPALPLELNSADNRPPSESYLAFRKFVQGVTNRWVRGVTDMCRRHGVGLWHYWGDAHVGVEPYLGGLEAGGISDIDKPCWGSEFCATIMRTLTDFPGPAKRRTRLCWLTIALNRPDPARDFLSWWREAKRALLFKMIDGLYWMPFEAVPAMSDAAMREDVLDSIKNINDDFLFMHGRLHGRQVFTHDLTLYVVNAWGKVYSWHPWPNRRGLPVFLENLTDLPIRVKFISLREIAKGIPQDADVLLNYGTPGSSWNGGYMWALPGVVENVRKFVADGGGFIGVGAPSHFEKGGRVWQLRDVLGVECAGEEPAVTEAHMTDAGKDHWIARSLPGRLEFHGGWTPRPVAGDLQRLFAAGDGGADKPAVCVRNIGKGRACYIGGYATTPEYYRLVRRAVFWCAGRERDLDRLCSNTPGVFTYLYPGIKTLVVYNSNDNRTKAEVKFDVSLLGLNGGARLVLRDAVSSKVVFSGTGSRLREGFELSLAPGAAAFLEAREK